ncbi:jg682, partial [Pararge aegeria aegeria]
ITYNLGKRQMFNRQLNEMEHRYTYFVPRDHAWLKFQIKHPSAYNALFREDFGYYVSMYVNTTSSKETAAVPGGKQYFMGVAASQ